MATIADLGRFPDGVEPGPGVGQSEGLLLDRGVVIEAVTVDAARMVTLEDPSAPPTVARDAFARIRPPEGMSAAETRSWVDSVRSVARAVRVLPARRAAEVPTKSTRVDLAGKPVGTVREEVADLVREADDPDLATICEAILAEVDRG